MRAYHLLTGCLLFFICFQSSAQQGSVQGTISDGQSHSPLSGATIAIAGTNTLESSDNFGHFLLSHLNPGEYQLLVSTIGYNPEKISFRIEAGQTTTLRINMQRSSLDLSAVTIAARKSSVLTSIAAVDIKLRPVNTSQDILRAVSGLFIAQHAGGGKAEQIFLRGYDIDHGTDINVTVDGIPVNMVSHAHGQGYADLHFLIPELVDKADFDKGPYFTSKGNLATAGYVELQTKDFLQNNMIKLQAGEFNTRRIMGQFKLLNKENNKARQQLYLASEYFLSDGYFDAPQDFHRFNIAGKYTSIFNDNSKLSIQASVLESKWNASGQIPDRAVDDGTISRFGSIDNSEGGNTTRTNISAKFSKQWHSGWESADQLYFVHYHFNLYSNFTFFLNDPVNGDEINQRETRNVYGYSGTMSKKYLIGRKSSNSTFGWGFRYDDVSNIALDHVVKRAFLSTAQEGAIHELNSFIYADQNIELSKKINLNAGIRYDQFRFGYKNILAGANSFQRQDRGTFSPKLNISYTANPRVKLYLNTGIGFHSNDTRVILNNAAHDILPEVFGTDLGIILKPTKDLILKMALWQLHSQQEFVYVGDEGIVEPGGRTRRTGIDFSGRYQVRRWLFADIDLNYAKPVAVDEPKGANYVPLAPTLTSIGGLTVKTKEGLNGSLRYRYIDDRPANEDNTVIAQGYFLLDAVISHTWKQWEVSASIENILNRYWKEAQFDTESRLKNEISPVSEIHYTPGTPRYVKLGISYSF